MTIIGVNREIAAVNENLKKCTPESFTIKNQQFES